jgi:hypothetical protein
MSSRFSLNTSDKHYSTSNTLGILPCPQTWSTFTYTPGYTGDIFGDVTGGSVAVRVETTSYVYRDSGSVLQYIGGLFVGVVAIFWATGKTQRR